jgi:hypothetical protein
VDSGLNSHDSYASYDPDTCCWRTCQASLFGEWIEYSETFPKSGMMRGGQLSPLPTSVPPTSERESGLWRTPGAHETSGGAANANDRLAQGHAVSLSDQVNTPDKWPTPTASEGGGNADSPAVRERGHGTNLQGAVKASPHQTQKNLWPTPKGSADHYGQPRENDRGDLQAAVHQATFPTPTAMDATLKATTKKGQKGRKSVALSHLANSGRIEHDDWHLWPTPVAGDASGSRSSKGKDRPDEGGLSSEVKKWPTPTAGDSKNRDYQYDQGNKAKPRASLGGLAKQFPTPTASPLRSDQSQKTDEEQYGTRGKPLPRVAGGQLNPTFVEWLMGFPKDWTDLG